MRPTSYPPQHERSTRNYTGVDRPTRYDESMRSDSPQWPERVAPLVEFLRTGPKTRKQIHIWARCKPGNQTQFIGVIMAEECMCWLEAQGKIERVDGKWRLTNG